MTNPPDILPFDQDAFDPRAPQKPGRPAVLGDHFAYIGTPLTVAQFVTYLDSYDVGSILPDYIVFHHTANPAASYAPLANAPNWDRNESGLTEELIRVKRKSQLDGLMRYYRDTLGWTAGPHLFIDEKYIWLFTPLADIGIHAKWGNSFRQGGRLHYGVGIEVIGYYGTVVWPAAVARNVRGTVRALRSKFGTFDLRYLYPENKPGMIGLGDHQQCAHPDRLRGGGISSHRDYNKPECPGSAITEDFYMRVLTAPDASQPPAPSPQPPSTYRVRAGVTAGATIRSDARRSAAQVGSLRAGDRWVGSEVHGETVALAGFLASDVWVCDGQRCVWSGLLERDS
jgi:hypothetical protein